MEINANAIDNDSDISDRKDRVTEKLQKRQEERLADQEKKRAEREESSRQGTVEYFNKTLSSEVVKIEETLKNIDLKDSSGIALPRTELASKFDQCAISVQKLQKFISDHTSVLPSYDIQSAQKTMAKLLTSISDKRNEIIPKKKFVFSSRKKESSTDKPKQAEVKKDEASKKPVVYEMENARGFSDKSNQDLNLSGEEIRLQDVSLQNLASCRVQLMGYPSAVHINNLQKCKIFCGPVPGSIFVDNCSDCIFIIACQQLRVHHSKDTSFYLHVTSKAIIEDTTAVHFAPYSWSYPGKDEDFASSGLDSNRNNWNDVDDFNWLASDTHSPNWDVIPVEEHVNVNEL